MRHVQPSVGVLSILLTQTGAPDTQLMQLLQSAADVVKVRVRQQDHPQHQAVLRQTVCNLRPDAPGSMTAASIVCSNVPEKVNAVRFQRASESTIVSGRIFIAFSSLQVVGVDDERHRAVVFGRDQHIRAELAVLRREAQPLALGQKLLVERNGNVGLSAAPMKLGRLPWLTSP